MLSLHVDAAAVVRDSLTGRNLTDAGLICVLDGAVRAPIRKADGYALFLGLAPGAHTLELRRPRYADERLEFTTAPGKTALLVLTMKPAADVRLAQNVRMLKLCGGRPDTVFWLASAPRSDIRLTADAAAGETSLRLFVQAERALALPATRITSDGEAAELCTIVDRRDGGWALDAPLRRAHRRGTCLWSAQRYRTDETGACRAALAGPVQAALFYDGVLRPVDEIEGETEWEIRLS